jgi:hypothetical protein
VKADWPCDRAVVRITEKQEIKKRFRMIIEENAFFIKG